MMQNLEINLYNMYICDVPLEKGYIHFNLDLLIIRDYFRLLITDH